MKVLLENTFNISIIVSLYVILLLLTACESPEPVQTLNLAPFTETSRSSPLSSSIYPQKTSIPTVLVSSTPTLVEDPPTLPPKVVTQTSISSMQTPVYPIAQTQERAYRWVQGIPCRAPCWEGITPGQTSATQALSILKSLPFVTGIQENVNSSSSQLGNIHWTSSDDEGGSGGISYNSKNLSQPIYNILVHYPRLYRLGEIIASYGNPTFVSVDEHRGPEGGRISHQFDLIYVNQRFKIQMADEEKTVVIDSDTLFFAPEFYASIINNGPTLTLNGIVIFSNPLPWHGFGSFDNYCHPTYVGQTPTVGCSNSIPKQ